MCPWAKLFSLQTKAWGAPLIKITCWKQWISVCLQPSLVLLPILLTWPALHLCWTGISHPWWGNGLVCHSFGHNKNWSSSPRQGTCFQITWWNTPPCCVKYPTSTGSVTSAFPPALLLHCAYLNYHLPPEILTISSSKYRPFSDYCSTKIFGINRGWILFVCFNLYVMIIAKKNPKT